MAPRARRVAGWALPPRPPDQWISDAWSAGLLGGVVLAVAVALPESGAAEGWYDAMEVVLTLLATAGALVAAYSLLVERTVRSQRRLEWAAAGFAVAYAVLIVRSLTTQPGEGGGLTYVLLLAVPLCVAASGALSRRALIVLPVGALVTVVVVALLNPPPGGRAWWVAVALLALLALATWRLPDGLGRWVSVALGLTVLTAVLGTVDGQDRAWPTAAAEAAVFLVPGVAAGVGTAVGFGRQSRRWRRLEVDVRRLRSGSALLPGRAVTPDNDEGLPTEPEVRALIDAGSLQVAIQRVVDLHSGEVVGHEALSRFGGRIPTDRWFKASSRFGLGAELERITLREALKLLSALPEEQFLAVNISPAALIDSTVQAMLRAADLSRIVVEITEHEAVVDYRAARETLRELRGLGARIAVDDTGAGFASLRHVLLLQPEVIKLDTSLIRGIESDRRQRALVRAVTEFAGQVGAEVLAEGIEEQVQLDVLREIGVDLGQGWHLGVPEIVV